MNGDIVSDKVCDFHDDRVAFADIDCRPRELPIDGHQRFGVAKAGHIRILHLYTEIEIFQMINGSMIH